MSYIEFNDAIEGYLESKGALKEAKTKPMTRQELDDLFEAARLQSERIRQSRAG